MLLLGIAATNSVTGKEDDSHKIKQAVHCMGPELLLNNAPPPPALNFVHFLYRYVSVCLSVLDFFSCIEFRAFFKCSILIFSKLEKRSSVTCGK